VGANSVRKKPCPYCGKKLQAKNKLKWRNNLARHLANACAPFQREQLGTFSRIACQLLADYMPGSFPVPQLPAACGPYPQPQAEYPTKAKPAVDELERLYALDSDPPSTSAALSDQHDPKAAEPANPKKE
jgi:hypothetical protein